MRQANDALLQDIIGTISLGTEMKSAMQEEEDEEEKPASSAVTTTKGKDGKPVLSPEEQEVARKKKEAKDAAEKKLADQKAKVREERVKMLMERLRSKLALFAEQAQDEDDEQIAAGGELGLPDLFTLSLTQLVRAVRTMWAIEAEELKQESYGVELLQTVGFVYSAKSKQVALFPAGLCTSLIVVTFSFSLIFPSLSCRPSGTTLLPPVPFPSASEAGFTLSSPPRTLSAKPSRPCARPTLSRTFSRRWQRLRRVD